VSGRIPRIVATLLGSLVLALAFLAAGCGDDDEPSAGSTPTPTASGTATTGTGATVDGTAVRIADKGFTESQVIAQIYAQALAAKGYKPDVTSLGGTEIADPAVMRGEIDMYPEYTGTAYSVVLGKTDSPDSAQVFSTIETEYAGRGLTALPASPYSNDNRVACTQEAVDQYGLKTLSDLGANSGQIVYSANPEHLTRSDGLPLLQKEYGVDFKDVVSVAINLRYKPVEDGQAQCVYAFGTDPQIEKDNLVVLEDDKGLFQGLPYENFVVVNTSFYEAQPPVFTDTVNAVSAALTDDAVRALNASVDLDKEDPEDVAAQFVEDNNLN
jgi:osmoprotectant transport system substrate-binding protein